MWRGIYLGLWISFFLSHTAKAQTLEQTEQFAQKALARGNYEIALPALQRLAFFKKGGSKALISYQIAQCYKAQGNVALANQYYDNCYYTAQANDSLAQEAVMGKISLLLSQRKFKKALAEIYSLEISGILTDAKRLAFLEGVALFGAQKFEKANQAFVRALPQPDSTKIKALDNLFSDKRLRTPKPKIARNLSFFLPGLGQFYAGDLKNGVNSLALNTAMLGLTYNIVLNYTALDAFLAVIPWFQRYYLGGTEKAEIIAQNKLVENQAEVYLEVLAIFSRGNHSNL
jgi:tetratricopeptide (TPR) repeat protein